MTNEEGSNFTKINEQITIGCISPEARSLLNEIMAAWEKHKKERRKITNKRPTIYRPTIYSFAYWLVRWSGLIEAERRRAVEKLGGKQIAQLIAERDELRKRVAELEKWHDDQVAICAKERAAAKVEGLRIANRNVERVKAEVPYKLLGYFSASLDHIVELNDAEIAALSGKEE